MNNPKISIIACISKNRGLGFQNQLLFHIPADMERFRKLTTGHVILMGQKTYLSIGKPLPDRTNIIISNDQNFSADGIVVAHSIEEGLEKAKELESEEIFICGGASIYSQTIDLADKLYLTVVEDEPEADAFFPEYDRDNYKGKSNNESAKQYFRGLAFRFLELERKK